jgi:hypothetical protein
MHFIEKHLFAMFGFFPSSIHIFMDVGCDDNNKVTMIFTRFWSLEVKDCVGWSLQVGIDLRSQGLHWLVTTSRCRIVEDQLFKKSH